MKIIPYLILIFTFLCCGIPDKKKDSEKLNKNTELQLKIEKPNAEKLFKNANTFFMDKKFEESKKELLILLKKYPTSKEVTKAKKLINQVNAELNKIRNEEQIIKEKNKRIKNLKIEQATKKLRKKVDNLENITWYRDRTSPQYTNYNGFFLYIGDRGNNYPTLRLRIQYKGDSWLFIEKYIIYVDGLKYKTIETEYGDVERDNGTGGVWEWYDAPITKYTNDTVNDFDVIRAIINGDDVKLKLIGRQYSKVKTITNTQKIALKNVLEVYKILGGEIY